ncbi:hypothetical protein [Herbaspirillum huttiense]|uniref:Uncharacterized protein n=1 Tax=Herbaspirillum huttiense subsp. lycopersici TaxID=3074428 RepID=A0ABU2EG01_9BURK|nr:hypothetical protein [Herbaspirillum huttiense]MDR9847060.1 hypothetical protein [Herbaspirillum huttiense SE1]
MHWIITKDLMPIGDISHVGKGNLPSDLKEKLKFADGVLTRHALIGDFRKTLNFEFRLFDDDGELYYEGKCGDLDKADQERAFEPLDWAMNDSGCTRMDYRKVGEREWKTL